MTLDRSKACPACGEANIDSRPALMAPFVARYVLDGRPQLVEVCECGSCGLVFFARPFTDVEVARLYGDYRSERYLKVRHGFEPWYTRRFNEDIGGEAQIEPRRRVYRAALADHADSVRTVLDYAGDRGQIMRGGPGDEHFVYDISGALPDDGVAGLSDPAQLDGRTFDLVLLCSVVEHFSWPFDQVRNVIRFVRPGGLLYVEVPDELFAFGSIPRGDWYHRYLSWLSRRPMLTMAADFYSTAARIKLGVVPTLGFVKQHEHLNYFSARSLTALLARTGLTLLSCDIGGGTVVALCRRPTTGAP